MHIDSVWYIVAVLGMALVAWLVRSFAESNPDSFLLNFTFFAFAGQCVLTAEIVRGGAASGAVFGLLLIGLILMLLQMLILRAQAQRTLEHYENVLTRNATTSLSPDEIEGWANRLIHITGVDFYPEFYTPMSKGWGRGPRHKRRKEAISVLPNSDFRRGDGGLTADDLLVRPEDRRWLWRAYASTCLSSWLIFVAFTLLVGRRP